MPPLLLYLRFPFCPMGCPFCREKPFDPAIAGRDGYLAALEREILAAAGDAAEYRAEALWLGGGIPSRIFDGGLGRLLRRMGRVYVMEGAEITLKTHPSFFSAQTLLDCRRGRITRLSIDLLTLRPQEAARMGRSFEADALSYLKMILAGMPLSLSCDVGLGLPGQDAGSLRMTLEGALSFGAGHIALHPYGEGSLALEAEADGFLQREGFIPYLPGRYALPGQECRYLLLEAQGAECLGFGPGAASRLDGLGSRNSHDLALYLGHSGEPERIIAQVHTL